MNLKLLLLQTAVIVFANAGEKSKIALADNKSDIKSTKCINWSKKFSSNQCSLSLLPDYDNTCNTDLKTRNEELIAEIQRLKSPTITLPAQAKRSFWLKYIHSHEHDDHEDIEDHTHDDDQMPIQILWQVASDSDYPHFRDQAKFNKLALERWMHSVCCFYMGLTNVVIRMAVNNEKPHIILRVEDFGDLTNVKTENRIVQISGLPDSELEDMAIIGDVSTAANQIQKLSRTSTANPVIQPDSNTDDHHETPVVTISINNFKTESRLGVFSTQWTITKGDVFLLDPELEQDEKTVEIQWFLAHKIGYALGLKQSTNPNHLQFKEPNAANVKIFREVVKHKKDAMPIDEHILITSLFSTYKTWSKMSSEYYQIDCHTFKGTTLCEPGQHVDHINYNSCRPNKCTCRNGIAVKSTKCARHRVESCESCNSGYDLIHGTCFKNNDLSANNDLAAIGVTDPVIVPDCTCEHGYANESSFCSLKNNGCRCCFQDYTLNNGKCVEGYSTRIQSEIIAWMQNKDDVRAGLEPGTGPGSLRQQKRKFCYKGKVQIKPNAEGGKEFMPVDQTRWNNIRRAQFKGTVTVCPFQGQVVASFIKRKRKNRNKTKSRSFEKRRAIFKTAETCGYNGELVITYEFGCGEKDELEYIKLESSCNYVFYFKTPSACYLNEFESTTTAIITTETARTTDSWVLSKKKSGGPDWGFYDDSEIETQACIID